MTFAYNHLNLPKLVTYTNGAQSSTIDILYDAAGTKLRKTVKTGSTTIYTQDYIGGIEYRDGAREAIYTAVPIAIGRVFYNNGTPRYEYSINPDSYRELGNARLSFTDKDNNGVVDVTANPATNEILQENHYYPFGLNTEGPWMNDAALDNRYQYNGKELNDDFGLNLYAYGARFYDPSLGRFIGVDPIADQFAFVTTFNYAENDPVSSIDLWGLQKLRVGDYTMAFILGAADAAVSNVTGKEKMSDETLISPLQGAMQAGEVFGDVVSTVAGGIGTMLGLDATVGGTLALPESGGVSSVAVVAGFELIDLGKTTSVNGLKNLGDDVAKMVDGDSKTYQTYTKKNETTGEVYSGRTSGTGTPQENIEARDSNHHMNDKDFGPAKLDKSSSNKDAIRGREQQLIDKNGGAKSKGGTSGNAINGVAPSNKNAQKYKEAAKSQFGE
jgi:RHS repeat-associated protein